MDVLATSTVKALAVAAVVISPAVVGALLLASSGDSPEPTVALAPRTPHLPERWPLPSGLPAATVPDLAGDLTGLTAAFAAAAGLSVPQALPGQLSLGLPLRRSAPAPSSTPAPPAGLAKMSAPAPVFELNWNGLIGRWF